MFEQLKKKCSQMTKFDWIISGLLVIIIVAIVMWVHSDKQGDIGVTEEGFVDTLNTPSNDHQSSHCQHFREHFENNDQSGEGDTLQSIKDVTKDVKEDDLKILFIYHSQCGHCHDFKPMWQRLSEKYQSKRVGNKNVRLYSVGNDTNEALWKVASERFGVEGYPTIVILQNNGTKLVANEYTGPRNEFQQWTSYIDGQCNS